VYEGKTVAVVVPAHNEEALVGSTVSGIPGFVDKIFVVDDGSTDATSERAQSSDKRVELISHERNEGVGAAIISGYRRAMQEKVDVTCVMAADGQMDPDDLETLVRAIALDECDYAKANRLFTGQAWEIIPRTRYLGNAVLSFLTKIASGYWHVADSQSGYTAVNLDTLRLLDFGRVYRRYGFPNDMLVHLNVVNRRVRDYPSRPIYGVGERSGIRLRRVVPRISWLLVKGVLLASAGEVRHPRLSPACPLLFAGVRPARGRAHPRTDRDGTADRREPDPVRHHRPRRALRHLGAPASALRHVVRHGVEQGPPLKPLFKRLRRADAISAPTVARVTGVSAR